MGAGGKQQWAVIVPLKPLDSGKSRLGAEARRSELALAFARDVVTAAVACPGVVEVVVVTDDPRATAVLRSEGARVVALAGDLPALTTQELQRALDQAWDRRRCYVADADGVGTSMLTARPGIGLNASFGVASSDEHLASGAYLLDVDDCPGLRRDVDTPADLEAAIALGVGAATAAVLAPSDS